MFTYAPVDCKSISSYEATNGVYHGLLLRRPGCLCGAPMSWWWWWCVCVCVCGGGGVLLLGGGYGQTHFSFNKHGWPESQIGVWHVYEIIMGGEFDPGPVPYFRGDWSWTHFSVIFIPSADSFNNQCCHLLLKYTNRFFKPCPGKV